MADGAEKKFELEPALTPAEPPSEPALTLASAKVEVMEKSQPEFESMDFANILPLLEKESGEERILDPAPNPDPEKGEKSPSKGPAKKWKNKPKKRGPGRPAATKSDGQSKKYKKRCHKCNRSFDRSEYNQHDCRKIDQHRCNKCHAHFGDLAAYEDHMVMSESCKVQKQRCGRCKTTVDSVHFFNHKKVCDKYKELVLAGLVCRACHFKADSIEGLASHIEDRHEKANPAKPPQPPAKPLKPPHKPKPKSKQKPPADPPSSDGKRPRFEAQPPQPSKPMQVPSAVEALIQSRNIQLTRTKPAGEAKKTLSCSACSKTFSTFADLQLHANVACEATKLTGMAGNKSPCLKCHTPIHRSQFVNHLRVCNRVNWSAQQRCQLCGYTTDNKRTLDSHMLAKHPAPTNRQQKPVSKCDTCGKQMNRRVLAKHQRFCELYKLLSNEDGTKCLKCDLSFNPVGLKIHIRSMHIPPEDLMKSAGVESVVISDERSISVAEDDDDDDDIVITECIIKKEPDNRPDTDAAILQSLFVCPCCSGKMLSRQLVEEHIVKHHRMALADLDKLGAKITEEKLT